jgi:membrane-bound lytic murein transglycosylase B
MLSTALVSAMLASTVTAGAFVVPLAGSIGPPDPSATSPGPPSGSSPPAPTSAPTGAPPVGPTTAPGLRPARSGLPADVLRGWAQQLSVRTAIPVVALQAYGYAELVVTETTPGCRLSWSTLAAIGRVESDHGRIGGAVLQADGRAWPPIFGLALDGADDRRLITDTDNGTLDGDPLYDRAVGPMQFIPATWQRELVDATGDGVADPHNLHDAALAAANYLCRNNRDLSTADHWWQAVLAYNNVQSYAQDVFDTANEYGRRSRG